MDTKFVVPDEGFDSTFIIGKAEGSFNTSMCAPSRSTEEMFFVRRVDGMIQVTLYYPTIANVQSLVRWEPVSGGHGHMVAEVIVEKDAETITDEVAWELDVFPYSRFFVIGNQRRAMIIPSFRGVIMAAFSPSIHDCAELLALCIRKGYEK